MKLNRGRDAIPALMPAPSSREQWELRERFGPFLDTRTV